MIPGFFYSSEKAVDWPEFWERTLLQPRKPANCERVKRMSYFCNEAVRVRLRARLLLTIFMLVSMAPMASPYARPFQRNRCSLWEDHFQYDRPYEEFEGVVNYSIRTGQVEVKGENRANLIQYGVKIQSLIMSNNSDGLAEEVSMVDFRTFSRYADAITVSENWSEEAKRQLISRHGRFFYFLFDRPRNHDSEDPDSIDMVDMRTYLLCFHHRQWWRVLFDPNRKIYHLWFSMPGTFMESFAYAHIVVRIEDGGPRLAGF